jgi:hypothetical protein
VKLFGLQASKQACLLSLLHCCSQHVEQSVVPTLHDIGKTREFPSIHNDLFTPLSELIFIVFQYFPLKY